MPRKGCSGRDAGAETDLPGKEQQEPAGPATDSKTSSLVSQETPHGGVVRPARPVFMLVFIWHMLAEGAGVLGGGW